jgi:hypothetical protein
MIFEHVRGRAVELRLPPGEHRRLEQLPWNALVGRCLTARRAVSGK